MATSYQEPESEGVSLDYGYIFGFWKERWFRGWVFIELILAVGGYLMTTQGAVSDSEFATGNAPDVHLSLGGIMGAVALVYGFALLLVVGISIYFRLQKQLEPDVHF